MRYEKIIKRDDGSKVRITTSIRVDSFRDTVEYDFYIHVCEPRKRTWHSPHNFDSDYNWRRMSFEERKNYEIDKYLLVVNKMR
jgi:hypothetical protein